MFMNPRPSLFAAFLFLPLLLAAQGEWSVVDSRKAAPRQDWLIEKVQAPATVTLNADSTLVLSNGLVSRTFTLARGVATIGLDELTTATSFLRSVRPEARVTIDGHSFAVGGLEGQRVHNYLLRGWVAGLTPSPDAFALTGYRTEPVKERFSWKQHPEWMSAPCAWPLPGKELIFTYRLPATHDTLPAYLSQIEVEVHYELYDGMPVFCKWLTLVNHSSRPITLDSYTGEILAAHEPQSEVDAKTRWLYPNITVETEYNFGGMSDDYIFSSSVHWKSDSLYSTQVNYECTTPCLLEVSPQQGPGVQLASGETFTGFRVWELLNDSWERERKSLAYRRMMRAVAPWVNENPILMHVRSSDDAAVKKAVDQCAQAGFEMVIMTFGSGFDAEDSTQANLSRLRLLSDYARSRGIALGGYSLLASRSIDKENDVVSPAGTSPRFGNSPCLCSRWGEDYFAKLYRLYRTTGMQVLEHDGSYPGDVCASTLHPGHKGLADSQWQQFQCITRFYKWCRGEGIYLNVPDLYFLNGSNKTGMGYRENNWSLPRDWQEIIERQNIYDGTWNKTPSMGWMFVPLVEYHGGGKEATIEPLKEHLPHYGQRLANLLGNGVQACYRGPQLFDAPETEALVKRWVDFYKLHRAVLDGDIIHLRRPDGRDYDAFLHVNPFGDEKGLLMVYNPLDTPIERTLRVDLYYTGLKGRATAIFGDETRRKLTLSPDGTVTLRVKVAAKGQAWVVFGD